MAMVGVHSGQQQPAGKLTVQISSLGLRVGSSLAMFLIHSSDEQHALLRMN